MKTLIKSLVFALVLTACSTDNENLPANQNTDIETEALLIGKGDLFGNGDEQIPQQNLVIDSEAEWETLQLQMNTTNPCTTGFTETAIDFNQWTVIAVFDAIRGNGGHSIDIIEVVENETTITVTVDKLLNGDMTLVMTQPFHIVKIPATNKPVVFE